MPTKKTSLVSVEASAPGREHRVGKVLERGVPAAGGPRTGGPGGGPEPVQALLRVAGHAPNAADARA